MKFVWAYSCVCFSCLNTFDLFKFRTWPVLALYTSGCGLDWRGTCDSCVSISIDSAKLKSSTYFRWIWFKTFTFFFVTWSPTSFFWSQNPTSFTKIKNRNRPNKVPWGPPPGKEKREEYLPLYFTLIVLFVRKATTSLRSHPGTPISLNFVISVLWSCLLKALEKSTRQARTATDSISCWWRMKFRNSIK